MAAGARDAGADRAIRSATGRRELGAILVAATATGLRAILLGDDPDALARDLRRRFPGARLAAADPGSAAVVARVVGLIEASHRGLGLPLDPGGTAFQRRVRRALAILPAGGTATCAGVARAIGAPAATRAVGRACAANPLTAAIPCHRAMHGDGGLSGYARGVERERHLLDREAAASRADKPSAAVTPAPPAR